MFDVPDFEWGLPETDLDGVLKRGKPKKSCRKKNKKKRLKE
jgi:hypothetical protein